MTIEPRPQTAADIQARLAAEREGSPFLVYHDADGAQVVRPLLVPSGALVIGRESACDIWIDDAEVSRAHALLESVGGAWLLVDDGLSSNGTFVNGERINGRRRLEDGDRITLGSSVGLRFCAPAAAPVNATIRVARPAVAPLSPAQRRVLVALCRPYRDGGSFAVPAGNAQIAEELFLSIDAVKTHMRALYDRLGIADLPQQQKRGALVETAFRTGEITPRDLDS